MAVWGEESCIILMNISPEAAKVDLTGYEDWHMAASLCTGQAGVTHSGNIMDLPAYGIAILTQK